MATLLILTLIPIYNTRVHTVSAQNSPSIMPPMKGMTLIAWTSDAYGSTDFDQSLANLVETEANWVCYVVFWFMEDASDTSISPDPNKSPSNSSLEHAVQKAQEFGLKIALKPMVDVHDGTWRAEINPTSWPDWFTSYRAFINQYADFAETWNIELFMVGCELRSSQSETTEWENVISDVRARYNGDITYAANWDSYSTGHVGFWDDLDYVGVDAYFPLTNSYDPTVEELIDAWELAPPGGWWAGSTWTDDLYDTYTQTGKEIIFTEIGYASHDGINTQPWGFYPPNELDLQEQADCYQAALEAFKDKPWFEGWFWWNWETDPDAGGPGTPDEDWFTPQNKPAEDVLFEYYSRPRIESCDSNGAKKDTFNPGEPIYLNGSGFEASTSYPVYVVNDVTWSDNMAIPSRVEGTATSVSTNATGHISPDPTTVWSPPLTPGEYDIVVDVDGNGYYDEDVDALDDNDIVTTAGFFVIPEYALGTILAIAICFAGVGVYVRSKRTQKKPL